VSQYKYKAKLFNIYWIKYVLSPALQLYLQI